MPPTPKKMKQIEVVAAIIHDAESCIFATQRGYGEWKDFWEFPGGKMEAGESPEEALRREIWEELETRIVVEKLVTTVEYDYPKFHLTMHCFLCRIESGSLTLKEHEAARWLAKDELGSVGWLPADLEVVEKIKGLKTMKDNQQERFPIVDEEGTVIGQATRGECHSGSHLLHPVVHLHVFNARGDVYLQKRPEWKDIQPGKWDTAVGGHIDYGETPNEALLREVREELGITDFTPEFMGKYVFESQRESELVYVHRATYDAPIQPSKDELDGGRFWTIQEIREAIGQDILTPNFESEFQRFFMNY